MATHERAPLPARESIEDLLRATLAAAASAADGAVEAPPVASPRRPEPADGHRRRPWFAVAAAVVLAVTLIGTVLHSVANRGTTPVTVEGPGTTAPPSVVPPPGATWTSLADVEVPVLHFGYVPAGFVVSPPTRSMVTRGGFVTVSQQVSRPAGAGAPASFDIGITLMPFWRSESFDGVSKPPPPGSLFRYRRVPSTTGLDWVVREHVEGPAANRYTGAEGGNNAVTIGVGGSVVDEELVRFVTSISIERSQPFLDVQKADPALPDEANPCEAWKQIHRKSPSYPVPAPPGCHE